MKKIIIKIILNNGKEMFAELYPEIAPITVENFINLIKIKFFDNLIFHRVIENFVIQGGGHYADFKMKDQPKPIYGEFENNGWNKNSNLSHQIGVLSMARTGEPNSATSQFFICVGDASYLDKNYASFGKLINNSEKIALEISKVEVINDVPKKTISIKTMEIIDE